MGGGASEKTAQPSLGGRAAWVALLLLGLTQAASMIDRQILAILMPRIKADLEIGDAEMGLLYGTVFALFYAVFSLPLGRLADGWIRTRLLSVCIFGWSCMTALGGFANSFGVLALSRMGVGIGEASVQPATMSMLSDSFPKERRGTITSFIAASIALGLGGSLWLGGAVADGWDASFMSGNAPLGLKGWQAAFVAAALPGLVLSALLWRMREPVRGAADGIVQKPDPRPFAASWETLMAILPGFVWINFARRKAPVSIWMINVLALAALVAAALGLTRWTDSLRAANPAALAIGSIQLTGNGLQWTVLTFGLYVLISWLQSLQLRDRPAFALMVKSPSIMLLMLITALQTTINYGVMAWGATYIIKTFHQKPADVGLVYGALVAGIGIIGPLLSGPLSDWMNKRFAAGRMYVTLMTFIVSPCLAIYVYHAATLGAFYIGFAAYNLILTMWLPPMYASFLDLVLPRMRGMIISFYLLSLTIVGQGIGPYAIGLMSDVNGGRIGDAILTLLWLCPVLIVLVILLIWRMPKDAAQMIDRARAAGEEV